MVNHAGSRRAWGVQRLQSVSRNRRAFTQLLIPLAFLVAGWIAVIAGAGFVGVSLIVTGAVATSALTWRRTRVLQRRIDQTRSVLLGAAPVTPQVLLPSIPAAEPPQSPTALEPVALEALALAAGLPAGLFGALTVTAPTEQQSALLVLPADNLAATRAWVNQYHRAQWTTIGSESRGLIRGEATRLDLVYLADPGTESPYDGILDQSFFWWLPPSCHVFLVSADPQAFAERLTSTHHVRFGLVPLTPLTTEAIVLRPKE